MSTSIGYGDASSPLNRGLFGDCGSEPITSVRVRLPGCAPRVIKVSDVPVFSATGGFVESPSALGLPGFAWPLGCTRAWNITAKNASRFFLGRQMLRNHVVREPNSVLLASKKDSPEPLSNELPLLDKFWKPVHMRVGYFPRRETVAKGETSDFADPRVNWSVPKTTAVSSLKQALDGKRLPGARKTSEAPAGARLRARARWVLGLNPDKQRRFVGGLLSGRWTPDLSCEFAHPRLSLFVAARGHAVKFLGGGMLTLSKGDVSRDVAFVWCLHDGAVFRIVPELLARLSAYAVFRKRDAALVQSLRTRCQEWCKAEGVSTEVTADLIGPTVALAFSQTAQEKVGTNILEGIGRTSAVAESWVNAVA